MIKGKKFTHVGFAALVLGNSSSGSHSIAMMIVWGVLAVLLLACAAGTCYLLYILTGGRPWRPGDEVPDLPRRLPAPARMRDRG